MSAHGPLPACPRCGAPLATVGTPGGMCARCMLRGAQDPLALGEVADASPPPPAPPRVEELSAHFPGLELLELIGCGGMGAVYKARQRGLERLVALKILHAHVAAEPGFAERFAREARTLAALQHESIVSVHESGQAGPWYYFVMEHVDGPHLRQLMRERALAPRQALEIVSQICAALQYAHDQGVIHRDIKPENILLDRRGRVRILDFGLSKLMGREGGTLTRTHQVMGTPQYMAPEQWDRPREVDHRADIYALGVVLYELLTGELPVGRFEPPSHRVAVDVRLDEVVLRSLERMPERRYQHASQVKTRVDAIAAAPGRPRGWRWRLAARRAASAARHDTRGAAAPSRLAAPSQGGGTWPLVIVAGALLLSLLSLLAYLLLFKMLGFPG